MNKTKTSLAERDQAVIWHPFTQMKTAAKPIPIVRAEGAYLFDENGKRYLDGISSWWVNLHGHAHPYIAQKVSEQLLTLEQVIFADFTHEKAVVLAERLLGILPTNFSKIFYSDNGSTAVEVALKMAFQYWHNVGKPQKTKVIALENAYHGDTFGSMSVSGRSAFTSPFNPFMFEVMYLPTPTPGNEEACLTLLQKYVENADEIASFVFEPLIQGAGGMLMYEPEILDKLLRIAQENNILTIADEVMTGFGRTGKYFASDYLAQKPDLICLSKGLTGGTMALGVTACTQKVYEAFLSDDKFKTFFHGHSFTANPLACTAALASLDLLQQPETWQNINRIVTQHQQFIEKQKPNSPHFFRQRGTILAIELNTPNQTSYFNNIRDIAYLFFLEKGILMRPLGNIIYILPPYCILEKDLNEIYEAIDFFLLTETIWNEKKL
jgi:adenosylmethionine---8-amino-7-oxononanoate aminotransferase